MTGLEPMLELVWEERAFDEKPSQTIQSGFGSTVLKRVVPRSLSGETTYQINSSSVTWKLKAPLRSVGEVVTPLEAVTTPTR